MRVYYTMPIYFKTKPAYNLMFINRMKPKSVEALCWKFMVKLNVIVIFEKRCAKYTIKKKNGIARRYGKSHGGFLQRLCWVKFTNLRIPTWGIRIVGYHAQLPRCLLSHTVLIITLLNPNDTLTTGSVTFSAIDTLWSSRALPQLVRRLTWYSVHQYKSIFRNSIVCINVSFITYRF